MASLSILTEQVAGWSVERVVDWARVCYFPESVLQALKQNEIDGETIITLTRQDLRDELRISSLVHRRRLFDEIGMLRAEARENDVECALKVQSHEVWASRLF